MIARMEEWRDIPGHPGYQASSGGNVRSVDRVIIDKNGRNKRLRGRALRPSKTGPRRDYLMVMLGARKPGPIHVLVCAAFHGPRPAHGYDASHRDGNSFNNAAANLRWLTRQGNEADKILHGTKAIGSRHGQSRLTEDQVLKIRSLDSLGASRHFLAGLFAVHVSLIDKIRKRLNWKHI